MADAGYLSLNDSNRVEQRQGAIVASAGLTGHEIDNLDDLAGLETLFLVSTSTFGNYTGSKLLHFIDEGGSVFLNEPSEGVLFNASNHAQQPDIIRFVDDTGPSASGPGGVLADGALDDGYAHTHGTVHSHPAYYMVESSQDREVAFLATEDDPTAGVTVLAPHGHGYDIETSIFLAIDFVLGSGEIDAAFRNALAAYCANTMAYAATLQAAPEVMLTATTYAAGDGGEDIFGRVGADRVTGGAGADIFHGGGGADTAAMGHGADIAWGGAGDDRLGGGEGNDQLWGGAGDDQLDGGAGGDFLVGGTGADRIVGRGSADSLLGVDGDDRLLGGGGADVLAGGIGRDVLTGGAGADRFMFLNEYPWQHDLVRERITDFMHGEDKIDLTGSVWSFALVDGFHGAGGSEIAIDNGADGARVYIDEDGDSVTDVTISVTLAGGPLTADDFMLG